MLRHVEQRIHAMIGAWEAGGAARKEETAPAEPLTEEYDDLLNGPPKDGDGLKQHDVDAMLTQGRSVEAAPNRTAPSRPEGCHEPESSRFERPEPLTLSELHAVKRAALFG